MLPLPGLQKRKREMPRQLRRCMTPIKLCTRISQHY
nr:MAG TPA: hypothetical protein [Caudoviricetes sp.]